MTKNKTQKPTGKNKADENPKDNVTEAVSEELSEDNCEQTQAMSENTLETLESEVSTLKDQLLRALAEAENTRRRVERERKDLIRYGVTNFVRDILAVADNLRRALESVPSEERLNNETIEALAAGVELTEKEFLSALERHGVQKIEPLGELFDHNIHQALFELENTGKPAGTITELMQPGYLLHDRLLRPAMVGVAKGDPETPLDRDEQIDNSA